MGADRISIDVVFHEQQATTSIKNLNTALGTVEQKAATVGKKTAGNIDHITVSLQKANNAMMGLQIALGALGGGGIISIIRIAGEFERAQVAMATLTGSMEEGNSVLNQALALTLRRPFTFPELRDTTVMLTAFGFKGQEAVRIMAAASNAASVLGVTMEDQHQRLTSITLALGEIQSKQRVNAMQITRQLGQAGVPALKYISDIMKIKPEDVMKLMEKGHLDPGSIIEMIQRGLERDGRLKAGEKIAQETLLGQWSNLMDRLVIASMAVGKAFLPQAKSLVSALAAIATYAKTAGDAFNTWPNWLRNIAFGLAAVGLALTVLPPIVTILGFLYSGWNLAAKAVWGYVLAQNAVTATNVVKAVVPSVVTGVAGQVGGQVAGGWLARLFAGARGVVSTPFASSVAGGAVTGVGGSALRMGAAASGGQFGWLARALGWAGSLGGGVVVNAGAAGAGAAATTTATTVVSTGVLATIVSTVIPLILRIGIGVIIGAVIAAAAGYVIDRAEDMLYGIAKKHPEWKLFNKAVGYVDTVTTNVARTLGFKNRGEDMLSREEMEVAKHNDQFHQDFALRRAAEIEKELNARRKLKDLGPISEQADYPKLTGVLEEDRQNAAARFKFMADYKRKEIKSDQELAAGAVLKNYELLASAEDHTRAKLMQSARETYKGIAAIRFDYAQQYLHFTDPLDKDGKPGKDIKGTRYSRAALDISQEIEILRVRQHLFDEERKGEAELLKFKESVVYRLSQIQAQELKEKRDYIEATRDINRQTRQSIREQGITRLDSGRDTALRNVDLEDAQTVSGKIDAERRKANIDVAYNAQIAAARQAANNIDRDVELRKLADDEADKRKVDRRELEENLKAHKDQRYIEMHELQAQKQADNLAPQNKRPVLLGTDAKFGELTGDAGQKYLDDFQKVLGKLAKEWGEATAQAAADANVSGGTMIEHLSGDAKAKVESIMQRFEQTKKSYGQTIPHDVLEKNATAFLDRQENLERARLRPMSKRDKDALDQNALDEFDAKDLARAEDREARKTAISNQNLIKNLHLEEDAQLASIKRLQDAQLASNQLIHAENQKLFDMFQRQAEGLFDAIFSHSKKGFKDFIVNLAKTTILTPIKSIVSGKIAQVLTEAATGHKVTMEGGKPKFGEKIGEGWGWLTKILGLDKADKEAAKLKTEAAAKIAQLEEQHKATLAQIDKIDQEIKAQDLAVIASDKNTTALGVLTDAVNALAQRINSMGGGGGGVRNATFTIPGVDTGGGTGDYGEEVGDYDLGPAVSSDTALAGHAISGSSKTTFSSAQKIAQQTLKRREKLPGGGYRITDNGGSSGPYYTPGGGASYPGGPVITTPPFVGEWPSGGGGYGSAGGSAGGSGGGYGETDRSTYGLPTDGRSGDYGGEYGKPVPVPKQTAGAGGTVNDGLGAAQQAAAYIPGKTGSHVMSAISAIQSVVNAKKTIEGLKKTATQLKGGLAKLGNLGGGAAGKGIGGAAGGAMMVGGAALFAGGLYKGGLTGLAMTTAGGALFGAKFGPMGAAIGAGVGLAAGIIRMTFFESRASQIKKAIQAKFGVLIDNKGILGSIDAVIKQSFGGSISLALNSPQIRDMVTAYAMQTGQKPPIAAMMRPVNLVQSGGQLQQSSSYINGQAYGYGSSLPSNQPLSGVFPQGSMNAPYASTSAAASASMMAGAQPGSQAISLKLDAKATESILSGKAVETLQRRPDLATDAVMNSFGRNYGREGIRSAITDPLNSSR